MPNGGMLPCCHICKWATVADPLDFNVYCQRHSIPIRFAMYTFCSDLSRSDGFGSPLPKSIQFESSVIYHYIEIAYKNPAYPTLPMYLHDYAPLAPVAQYALWTEEQERAANKVLRDEVVARLLNESQTQIAPKSRPLRIQIISFVTHLLNRLKAVLQKIRR